MLPLSHGYDRSLSELKNARLKALAAPNFGSFFKTESAPASPLLKSTTEQEDSRARGHNSAINAELTLVAGCRMDPWQWPEPYGKFFGRQNFKKKRFPFPFQRGKKLKMKFAWTKIAQFLFNLFGLKSSF